MIPDGGPGGQFRDSGTAVIPGHRRGFPHNIGLVEELFQGGLARALHPGPAHPARFTGRRGCVEGGIQAQPGDEGNRIAEGLTGMEQVQDSVAAIPHQYQGTDSVAV